uniref:Uncharacterized protein n=1 Tax=Rhizophora mucronata TaxID=61149 RepID=A0A2P2PPG2_RHIMU
MWSQDLLLKLLSLQGKSHQRKMMFQKMEIKDNILKLYGSGTTAMGESFQFNSLIYSDIFLNHRVEVLVSKSP